MTPANVPVSHPLRWPGSVWRKQEPGKLCRIASLSMSTEIDLAQALEALRAASGGPRTGPAMAPIITRKPQAAAQATTLPSCAVRS